MKEILFSLFSFTNIWSFITIGIIWLIIMIVVIVSMDNSNPDLSASKLKSNLGFLLLFSLLAGAGAYLYLNR